MFGSGSFLEEKKKSALPSWWAGCQGKGIRPEWQDLEISKVEAKSASWPRLFWNKANCPTSPSTKARPKLFTPHWLGGDFLIQSMLEAAAVGSCKAFKKSSHSACRGFSGRYSKYHHCHSTVDSGEPVRSNRVSGCSPTNCLSHLHRCLNTVNVRLELVSFPTHYGMWRGSTLRATEHGWAREKKNQTQQFFKSSAAMLSF